VLSAGIERTQKFEVTCLGGYIFLKNRIIIHSIVYEEDKSLFSLSFIAQLVDYYVL